MKIKIFGFACLGQFIAFILTLPILFFISVTAWADQCSHDGTSSCQAATVWGGIIYVVLVVAIAVVIGGFLLRRFAGYPQAIVKTLIKFGILGIFVALCSLLPDSIFTYSSGSGILVYFIYPLYTLFEYSSKTNTQPK